MSEEQIALALEDDVRRQQNGELLAELNAAYAEEITPAEQAVLREARKSHARRLKDEW